MRRQNVFVVCKTIVVNEHGEILVLKRSPLVPRRPGEWDLPGGSQDPGEGLTHAAIRETVEEAAVVLREPRLVYAHTEMRDYGSGSWLFFVEHVQHAQVQISAEHTDWKWVQPTEAVSLIDYVLHKQVLGYVLAHDLLRN